MYMSTWHHTCRPSAPRSSASNSSPALSFGFSDVVREPGNTRPDRDCPGSERRMLVQNTSQRAVVTVNQIFKIDRGLSHNLEERRSSLRESRAMALSLR